jgi:two-component system, OmpR family, alkaline phosphatase synthesis response regulator PhoP
VTSLDSPSAHTTPSEPHPSTTGGRASTPESAAKVAERAVPIPAELSADLPSMEPRVRHVLVADDEPHIGRIIQMKLEQGPFRVTLAYDGRQAVDALEREGDIDLVLLDLMMPELSGLDVLARMRDDARFRDLPCIILTAAGQEQQYRQAMALGATDFMTKPFSPKKLYARAAELAGITDEMSREDR